MNNRFQNYGLWVSMFSLLGLLLQDIGLNVVNFPEYVDLILAILVGAGVIMNPSLGTGYMDKMVVTEEAESLE